MSTVKITKVEYTIGETYYSAVDNIDKLKQELQNEIAKHTQEHLDIVYNSENTIILVERAGFCLWWEDVEGYMVDSIINKFKIEFKAEMYKNLGLIDRLAELVNKTVTSDTESYKYGNMLGYYVSSDKEKVSISNCICNISVSDIRFLVNFIEQVYSSEQKEGILDTLYNLYIILDEIKSLVNIDNNLYIDYRGEVRGYMNLATGKIVTDNSLVARIKAKYGLFS